MAAQRGDVYYDDGRSFVGDDPPAVVIRGNLDSYLGPAPTWFAEATGIQTTMAVPVRVNAKPVGCLSAGSRTPESFDDFDIELMQLLPALVGASMEVAASSAREQEADRLRVLGQLSAGVAHDINNALSTLRINLWLLPQYEEGEARSKAITSMRQASDRIASTVRRIQEYVGASSRERPGLIDLGQATLEAVGMTASKWRNEAFEQGKSIEVTSDVAEGVFVLGSKNAVIDAVANLIINAVDAIDAQGKIQVSLQADRETETATLRVADDGVGMDETTRSQVFDAFFSTRDNGQGLGLSILAETFRSMDGSVWVESEMGEGATFTVTVPLAGPVEPAEEQADGELPGAMERLAGKRVLVIDDEESVLDSTRRLLEIKGCEIEDATSGGEAIEKFGIIYLTRGSPCPTIGA